MDVDKMGWDGDKKKTHYFLHYGGPRFLFITQIFFISTFFARERSRI